MPKTKATASLSGMIESDMEEVSDVEMMPTPDSNQENTEPAKKAPGRPKAPVTKPRKTKPASRRLSGGPKPKAPTRKKAATKRLPLEEQNNEQHPNDMEEVDDFADEVPAIVDQPQAEESSEETGVPLETKKNPGRKGKAATKGKQPVRKHVREEAKVVEKDGEFEYTPTAARQSRHGPKISGADKQQSLIEQKGLEKVIPESQPPRLDDDDDLGLPNDLGDPEEAVPQSVYRQVRHAQSSSKQPQPSVIRRRVGSASDTEKGGTDPTIRRKLGEMTKKFESLDLKYRTLREVGVREAEANFEKLKKQSEERTKCSNDLIASLKKELINQKSITSTIHTLRDNLTTTEASLSTAQTRISELSAHLNEVQNENKALSAKLAASRSASVNVESASAYAKTPGSALKGKGPSTRTIMVGSAEAAQAAQVAQLKQELYADLTGLILRGVDRTEDTDTYDCIQTGRNGTLHFKLAVATDTSATASYEETEFQYTPRFDSDRDRDLLDLLPDYLTDEITFSRQHAAKFYSRVVDTLTKSVKVEN
ncbi:hypothetical protein MMC13_008133 [Lambiella insularis]|nr:hypothetical protein [Lambiella insularis]